MRNSWKRFPIGERSDVITVTYHRLVQKDVQEVCDYYDAKREGLGDAFFVEFEAAIEAIRWNPGKWPPLRAQTDKRKARLKRFPYVIVYRELGAHRVRVLVVKHRKRREALGMRRK